MLRVSFALFSVCAWHLAPVSAQIPKPESILGFPVGADFELATYEQSLDYFQQLAEAADRVELREIGRTSFGRPWYLALISSAENLRNVERYREIAHQLAYPAMLRRLTFNGIGVRRLGTSVTLDGMTHPVGSWVIPMDQPKRQLRPPALRGSRLSRSPRVPGGTAGATIRRFRMDPSLPVRPARGRGSEPLGR